MRSTNAQPLTEDKVCEPLKSYFAHGQVGGGGDCESKRFPFVVFGPNSERENLQKVINGGKSSNMNIESAGLKGANFMICHGVSPKGPISCSRSYFITEFKDLVQDYVERIKQNFDDDVNKKISEQIRLELQASYIYLAYSQYFSRADVALPAFAKYFEDASKEEREHATYLMHYLNKRGGFLTLFDIEFTSVCQTIRAHKDMLTLRFRSNACICYFMSDLADENCPNRKNWKNGLWAMQDSLILERFVTSSIYDLHDLAGKVKDDHFEHVLEHHFLDEQIKSVQKISEYIRKLERVGDDLGEYLFSL